MLTIPIPRHAVIRALHQLGYLAIFPTAQDAVSLASDDQVDEAVKSYQRFHGEDVDGIVGPRTASRMMNPLRCGMPDLIGNECQWPHKDITYRSVLTLPGLSAEQAIAAADEAAAQINAVCGAKLRRVDAAANIMARSGRGQADGLDGRSGTLGYAYRPCGKKETGSVNVVFDADENWNYSMAVAVICHEFGHAVGLPHLPNGNLMQPYYSAGITKLQAGDIAELVKRYGQPVATPTPAPDPGEVRTKVTVTIGTETWVASGPMRRE